MNNSPKTNFSFELKSEDSGSYNHILKNIGKLRQYLKQASGLKIGFMFFKSKSREIEALHQELQTLDQAFKIATDSSVSQKKESAIVEKRAEILAISKQVASLSRSLKGMQDPK